MATHEPASTRTLPAQHHTLLARYVGESHGNAPAFPGRGHPRLATEDLLALDEFWLKSTQIPATLLDKTANAMVDCITACRNVKKSMSTGANTVP